MYNRKASYNFLSKVVQCVHFRILISFRPGDNLFSCVCINIIRMVTGQNNCVEAHGRIQNLEVKTGGQVEGFGDESSHCDSGAKPQQDSVTESPRS